MDNADIPLSVLNLPRSLKASLAEAGYKNFGDVRQISAADLSAELGISVISAAELLVGVETYSPARPQTAIDGHSGHDIATAGPSQIQSSTAADLLTAFSSIRFSTQSTSLDSLIAAYAPSVTGVASANRKGKGRAVGSITPGMTVEISGPPGGGKTAVALGVVLSARLPFDGEGEGEAGEEARRREAGEVLVVDTEGAITPERLYEVAEILTQSTSISPLAVLEGIHLVRIPTQVQMIAFLHTLDEWLDEHPKVNLVVIDTLSYHFRQPGLEISARRRIMDLVKQKFGKATTINRCAVVVTNQLATKLLTAENKPANFDTGDRAVLMPQLGDAWITGKTLRLVLFRGPNDDLRYAHASMSGSNKNVPWACFDIDSDGIPCDVPESLYKPPDPLQDEIS